MKSSPDVANISQESVFLITKATEHFVEHIARTTVETTQEDKAVTYNMLADIVDEDETLQFLQDIIPRKIKVKDFEKLMQKRKQSDEEDD